MICGTKILQKKKNLLKNDIYRSLQNVSAPLRHFVFNVADTNKIISATE